MDATDMRTLEQLREDYHQSLREIAAANPVPLPNNPEMLRDLASIGVPGAAEKLSQSNPVRTLDEIAIHHQTDRASVFTRTYGKPHGYASHYDRAFGHLRHQPVKLLEIGAAGGEGIKMWLDYFDHPKSRVVGVDIVSNTNDWNTPGSSPTPRYKFCQGDQVCSTFWACFIADYGKDWDVVIDDGGHFNDQIITTFNALWPVVKPGGFYAIEDLGVDCPGSIFVKPGFLSHTGFLNALRAEMNIGLTGIDSMHESRELAILRKAMT